MRQPWSLLSLKNMVAPWMHPMEKAMNIKSPGSQVQVMMWCFCCDFLLIWSSLEIVILYTGILRGFEQPSFIGLSPMMRVPFPNPKTRIWRGFSKEVVAFPHQSWMPLLSVAFQPGYLDLGTAVAVVTMLSSDYVSWWNGGGAITQHRCRGLLGIHHLATARMSIIKNWIAFIGFISVWMVCLTEFSASKKKVPFGVWSCLWIAHVEGVSFVHDFCWHSSQRQDAEVKMSLVSHAVGWIPFAGNMVKKLGGTGPKIDKLW